MIEIQCTPVTEITPDQPLESDNGESEDIEFESEQEEEEEELGGERRTLTVKDDQEQNTYLSEGLFSICVYT